MFWDMLLGYRYINVCVCAHMCAHMQLTPFLCFMSMVFMVAISATIFLSE
jgi:hypothetical protein